MRVAICDDEKNAREFLREQIHQYLAQRDFNADVKDFSNSEDLLRECDWDVVFLDIRMPGTNGMDAAHALRKRSSASRIIFTTVLREYVFDAFEVDATDYLVKPIAFERLSRTLDRILQPKSRAQLTIQRGSQIDIVRLDQIAYCEVQKRKLTIHTEDGRILTCNGSLQKLESQLDDRFFKCHRSYLVNLEQIAGWNKEELTMAQGDHVPVSRLREKNLRQAIMREMAQS